MPPSPGRMRRPAIAYASANGKGLLIVGDSRTLPALQAQSVAVIVTSPPYWVIGRGRKSAGRYARRLATESGREWHRVLASRGDLWIIIGDRHDGREWIGIDGFIADSFNRTGWSLQAKGLWAEHPSTARWDSRVNYILRFTKNGVSRRPPKTTLCWRLPIPRSPRESLWNVTPPSLIRALLRLSPAGIVLDPFFGSGTVGFVASQTGRPWIGIERDRNQARVAVRRLHLTPVPMRVIATR
jgi:site-specific DNA-methyltransferase (cytosine-N4-specific)